MTAQQVPTQLGSCLAQAWEHPTAPRQQHIATECHTDLILILNAREGTAVSQGEAQELAPVICSLNIGDWRGNSTAHSFLPTTEKLC